MKEIVILSCWPSTEDRENQLLNLIKQFKKLNKEILIASHYPIPDYIVSQVDYYIYDKTNTLHTNKTLKTYPADYYFKNEKFEINAITIAHSAAISRICNLAFNFIEHLGYEYFIFLESDVEFDENDLIKLNNIKQDLTENNKKLFFFKLGAFEYPYWENNGIFEIYETACFGGILKEFNSKIVFPKTLDEWNQILILDKNNHGLEYFVTNVFNKHKEDYHILNSTRKEFSNSKINSSSTLGYDGVYCNTSNENLPVLFFLNEGTKIKTYKIFSSIWMPHIMERTISLPPNTWWYDLIDISEFNRDIKIIVYEEDKIIKSFNILVDKKWINQEKNIRQITFK
jgi:hypothetical protein